MANNDQYFKDISRGWGYANEGEDYPTFKPASLQGPEWEDLPKSTRRKLNAQELSERYMYDNVPNYVKSDRANRMYTSLGMQTPVMRVHDYMAASEAYPMSPTPWDDAAAETAWRNAEIFGDGHDYSSEETPRIMADYENAREANRNNLYNRYRNMTNLNQLKNIDRDLTNSAAPNRNLYRSPVVPLYSPLLNGDYDINGRDERMMYGATPNDMWTRDKQIRNGSRGIPEFDVERFYTVQGNQNADYQNTQGGSRINKNFYGYRDVPQNRDYNGGKTYRNRNVPVTDDLGIYNEYYPPEERPFYNGEGNANRLNKDNSQPVRRVAEPMNAEANAQAQRGATQAELQRLAKTNPSLFRQIAKVMADNPLEGGKLFGMAAVPFAMAGAGQDPMTNYIGGTGMLAGSMANTAMDASMVAQPFVDAYGYVQSPEYIEERRRQMEEGLD